MAAETEFTKYICLFHQSDRAASAIRDLEQAGFSRSSITAIYGKGSGGTNDKNSGYASEYVYNDGNSGDLTALGVPDRDQKHLKEGLDSGGVVIGLDASGERADEIEHIFHKYTAAKIDETSEDRGGYAAPIAAAAAMPAAATATDSIAIPVVDEELIVGKREVERGGVRVYRRVVEEPVSESVSLREERVNVQRRPVDRAVTDADYRAGDQTIELTETAEEAVVAKTARVVEEVRVGKEATERTETVRDTVRHTEVDVEPVEGIETTSTPRKNY